MNVKQNVLRLALTTTLATGAFVLHGSTAAASGSQVWSWNLSRDMIIDAAGVQLMNNPLNNVWELYEAPSPWGGPPNPMTPLSSNLANGSCWGVPWLTCWTDPNNTNQRNAAMVAMSTSTVTVPNGGCSVQLTNGVPILHPGPNTDAIVRWTNPLGHAINIQILGRFTNIDPCGPFDGVEWTLFDQNGGVLDSSTNPLISTWAPFLLDSDFVYVPPTLVQPGDTIDFVVHRRGDYYYDGTELDVVIVGQ